MDPELTGARLLAGTIVDPAGVLRSKQVPIARAAAFEEHGMGVSPSWNVFCIDNAVAFTSRFGVVGDLRLRVDLPTARSLGDGLAWAPAEMVTQQGEPTAVCSRTLLRRRVSALAEDGFTARAGGEVEFVITKGDGTPRETPKWNPYGLSAVLDTEAFLTDLAGTAETVGLPVEQVHAEYGDGQFELSLSPTDPVTAADNVVLARILIGRVARRHGLTASFSPLPFSGGSGNGAHLHLSLAWQGRPLLSGGAGPHGLTHDGGAMIGGLVAGLPEVTGVLAGSVLSAQRLRPGQWAGAFACWGLENREAAVRLCAATPGAAHGASLELKCVDPSANPYLAVAVLLGLAHDGLTREAALPPEVTADPAGVAGALRLPSGQAAALTAMEESAVARRLLGEEILEALSAVRRHELDTYGEQDLATITELFRFAWS